MDPFSAPVVRFAGVEIDVQRERLFIDGVEQHLRRKTLEVLLYLIDHRDRVVSKTELFDAVWSGIAVTEDTLVQSIVEIRKALDDDPKSPRFVRTIPRVGYRFIADEEQDAGEVTVVAPVSVLPRAGDVRPTVVLEETRSIELSIEESDDWRHFIPHLTVAAVVLILGTIGAMWMWRGSAAEPVAAPASSATAPVRVAVARFESSTSTSDLDWLHEGLPTMITTNLSREASLSIVRREARATAQRVITGTFERSGDRIRVDAQLLDGATGRVVGGGSIVSTRTSLLDDVDVLSSKLGALLGARPATSTRSSDRMTDSLEAYEAYSLGLEAAHGLQSKKAVEHFEKAAALDPGFAMAHARIGYVYALTWSTPEQGKPYFAKALALGDRLSERERLYVLAWQAIADRDYVRAIDHCRLLVSRYPTDVEAYDRLGRLLTGEERLAEAIETLNRGLVVDPHSPELNNAIGNAYSYSGRHAEAIRHHQRYVAALPQEPNAHDSLGLSHQWAGEYQRALAAYDTALKINPRFEIALVHRANTNWQLGRNRQAIRELEQYIAIAPSALEKGRGYGDLSILYRHLGDRAKQRAAARARMATDREIASVDVLLPIDDGDLVTAKRLLEAMPPARAARGSRMHLRANLYVHAELARATGDAERAIDYARQAVGHIPPVYLADDMEDALGDMLAAFGHHAEAVDEYRRVLKINPNRGRTRYKLARSLDSLGRNAEARETYTHFLRTWSGADADAPEVVDARRRLHAALPLE
jgi:tetratricopeptide (TPR) repeat protein/DNA-binding winged helix-turn-helix (wHTH) protein